MSSIAKQSSIAIGSPVSLPTSASADHCNASAGNQAGGRGAPLTRVGQMAPTNRTDDSEWDCCADPLAPPPEQPLEPVERSGRSPAEVAALGTPTDKPPSRGFREVELLREHAQATNWEPVVSAPGPISPSALSAEQWSLIEALHELRVLSLGQIQREFLTSISERQIRRELSLLRVAGAIRRGGLRSPRTRGSDRPMYVLAERGFALLRDSPDHPASGAWRQPKLNSAPHVVHDLERNEWLFSFRSLAPRQLVRFWGARSGRIKVPTAWEPRGGRRPLVCSDMGARAPQGLVNDEFSNIVPDLTLELQLEEPEGEGMRTDLLIEIESGNNNTETVRRKAQAYDGLLNGWWEEHPRYKAHGRPPSVVFVVPERRAHRYIAILDEALQGHWVIPPKTQTRAEWDQGIVPRAKQLYMGRQHVYVAAARDVHQRTLRAWRVPAVPPDQRVPEARDAAERRQTAHAIPRRARLLDPRELVDPAT